ncbi:hypothetical protein HII36_29620 [Nonomuraea sp. NN258]|uniref:hypothetical protein n=1 Tax=Nonomuraea antri TaxID=2730852 RepID=UPI0015683789|nr:hypothetical protein [Nonomuraea antri]NRQ35960.1 hypothetical protein [Nonomuraea antri]
MLTNCLREVDERHGKLLSLGFAEHAIQVCRSALSDEPASASLAYLSAARAFLTGEAGMSALADAREAYFESRGDEGGLPSEITWIAEIAVSASCRRDMEVEQSRRGGKRRDGS